MPGKHKIKEEQQKAAISGTAHCCESTNVKVKNTQLGKYVTLHVPYIVTTE